ncbi:transketolase C-terminal domain-containing protein, partial [Vibrio parahaemolyticus]|uniref:transketolase C-terminal domain-containing protein n=1 Tax=Vibrio parahaemolyticus TaxID=670 RepID=UPI0017DCC791
YLNATVAGMRFVKPLDEALIRQLATDHDVLVTLEENVIAGGAGAGVVEFMMKDKIIKPVLNLGLPDEFIHQGTQDELHEELGLEAKGIEKSIWDELAK